MLQLAIDAEYSLTEEHLAELAGLSAVPERALMLRHMALSNGSLAIHTVLRVDDHTLLGQRILQFNFDGVTMSCTDLSQHTCDRPGARPEIENWRPIAFGDDVLYVEGSESALLVMKSGDVFDIQIDRGIGDDVVNERVKARMQPGRMGRGHSEGNIAAVPMSSGALTTWLAFINLDKVNRKASWSRFLPPNKPKGLLSRLFDRPTDTGCLAARDLIRLNAGDFPKRHEIMQDPPSVIGATIVGGRAYVFTKGQLESPKWGYDCADIAEIDADGRVRTKIYAQDFTRFGDGKKRGVEGSFTSSGRYCILKSVYRSTDGWNGRQVLFDMEEHSVAEVVLPRGHTKYQLIDHAGPWFWAIRDEAGKPRSLLRLASR